MAIGVNGNVNNPTDIQKLLKAMNTGKSGKPQGTKKAPGMSMNESVFDAAKMVSGQGVRRTSGAAPATKAQGAENVVKANTEASISDVKKTSSAATTAKTDDVKTDKGAENGKIDLENVDFDNLGSLNKAQLGTLRNDIKDLIETDCPFFLRKPMETKLGKVEKEIQLRGEQEGDKVSDDNKAQEEKSNEALKASAEDGAKVAGTGAADAQRGTAETNKMSQHTTDLQKSIETEEKNLVKSQLKAQSSIDKNIKATQKESANIATLTAENEQLSAEVEMINAQIETTRSTGGEGASDTIATLSGQVQDKTTRITMNSTNMGKATVAMHRYAAANGRTIKTLTKANKAYTKNVTAAQQQIQQNQEKSNGFMETMEKINDISSKVALAGSITKYTGIALSHTGFGASAGAAMITAGTIAETAGNYGVCAANIGKTAVYAAQGNIMGALTSAGTAIMSGATAVGNTKQMMAAADGAKAAGQASKKAAEESTKLADAAKEIKVEGPMTQVGESGGLELSKAGEAAMQKTSLEVGASVAKQQSVELAKNAGFKGFVNNLATDAVKNTSTTQALMGLGTSLQAGAAMFQKDGQGAGTVTTRTISHAQHFHRRKVG